MAVPLKPKRTGTTSKVPTTADIADGEMCVNYTDGIIYVRNGANIHVVGRASANVGAGAHGDIFVSGTYNEIWEINTGAIVTNKILNKAVTVSKIQNLANNTILGNVIGYAESPSALSTTQVRTLLTISNVSNTSDADKPVSTAQAASIALKVSLAGAEVITGDKTFGDASTQKILSVNGIASGTAGGSALYLKQGGVTNIALGSYSAIIGGAYDNRALLYCPTGLVVWGATTFNSTLNATGALTENGNQVHHAGNFNPAAKYSTVGGGAIGPSANSQGFEIHWNAVTSGGGRNEYINNFGGGDGGHYFYTRSVKTDAPVLRQIFYPDGRAEFGGNFFAGNKLKGGAWPPGNSQYGGIFHADMPGTEYLIISGGASDLNTYISTMVGAGGNVNIRPNGNVATYATVFTNAGIQTETNYGRRNAAGGGVNILPRIFVQSGDPGTAAADGDLWFW